MTIKTIWKVQIPVGSGFAELNRHYHEPQGKKCGKCGALIEAKHIPLTVEWEDGSDKIGDFVHAGADIVIQDRVVQALRRITDGFTTEPIVFFDHPNLRKPVTVPQNNLPQRVWLPYDGPALSQLIVTRKVPLADRSTIEVASNCADCGTIRYKRIIGVEKKTHSIQKLRTVGSGLFVFANDIGEDGFFSPIGTTLALCTSEVKKCIEDNNFSNVEFLEYGDVIDEVT